MLTMPTGTLLAPVLILAGLVLLGWLLRAPVPRRAPRHEAHPDVVLTPPRPLTLPGSEDVTWLDSPPPGLARDGSRLVPDTAACAAGRCDHRAHRYRPRTRPARYPAHSRAGAR